MARRNQRVADSPPPNSDAEGDTLAPKGMQPLGYALPRSSDSKVGSLKG